MCVNGAAKIIETLLSDGPKVKADFIMEPTVPNIVARECIFSVFYEVVLNRSSMQPYVPEEGCSSLEVLYIWPYRHCVQMQ